MGSGTGDGGPPRYDVHDTDQIPRTLYMTYCFCSYLYITNNPVPFVLTWHGLT